MEIARDAETLGLLFKAMAHYDCGTVPALAQRLGVDYGPALLVAIGIAEESRSRWAEAEALIDRMRHQPAGSAQATIAGDLAAAPGTATDAAAEAVAFAFPTPEVRRGPQTALGQLRETVGLTAGQLAAKVGVPVGTVGAWERGTATPAAEQVGRLAQALGVAPDEVRVTLTRAEGEGAS